MSLDVYLSISHLFFMASVLVTNKPETSGQPPSQARQHPRALARCDASSTRLKLRKNPTTTHETRPCTRRITLRLIDSLYARAPTASLRLIDLAYARAHWSKLFLNLQQLSELRHQGTTKGPDFNYIIHRRGRHESAPAILHRRGRHESPPAVLRKGRHESAPGTLRPTVLRKGRHESAPGTLRHDSAGQACSSPS